MRGTGNKFWGGGWLHLPSLLGQLVLIGYLLLLSLRQLQLLWGQYLMLPYWIGGFHHFGITSHVYQYQYK